MRKKWELPLVGGLLLIFLALLACGAPQVAITADEPTYITSGYALLARGSQVYPILTQRGYPPLLIALEGALVYLSDPGIPLEQLKGWPTHYAPFTHALWPRLTPLARTQAAARLPIMLLTISLAAIVFRWAKDLGGTSAGMLALLALICDPLLLGHGRLAHSDAGTVALGTAAIFVTWRYSRRPSWRRVLAVGVLLGLTMLAKVSGPLWLAAAGLMLAGAIARWRPRAVVLAQSATAIGVSLFLLWAGYGFEWGQVHGFPLPVPAPTYWESLRFLHDYRSTFFALGQHGQEGWWWYFPLAFLIKNPLPLLISLAISLVVLARRAIDWSGLTIVIFPLLYTGAALVEGMNVGYRHMLPVHPFLYLAIGSGLATLLGCIQNELGPP